MDVLSCNKIYRSGSVIEQNYLHHASIGCAMCKLFIQSFMHSGIISITRVLMNANNKIIKKYNLLKYIGSSRLEQISKQFKFSKRLLPLIPVNPFYVLIVSNQFRMTVPCGYSNIIKIPDGNIKSKQSVFGFRNNLYLEIMNILILIWVLFMIIYVADYIIYG